MKIDIEMLEGMQLKATFGKHSITSDQSVSVGGSEAFPEPFDFFLASLPLCAAFYVRRFCQQRDISDEGIEISQEHVSDESDKYKKHFTLTIQVPSTFPEKYKKALIAAVNTCTVKKVIQAQPEFSVELTQAD